MTQLNATLYQAYSPIQHHAVVRAKNHSVATVARAANRFYLAQMSGGAARSWGRRASSVQAVSLASDK